MVASVNSSGQWTGDGSLLTGGGVITETKTDSGSGLTFTNADANVFYGSITDTTASGTLSLPSPSTISSAILVFDNTQNSSAYTASTYWGLAPVAPANQYITIPIIFNPLNGNWNSGSPLYADQGVIVSDGSGNLHVAELYVVGESVLDNGNIGTNGAGQITAVNLDLASGALTTDVEGNIVGNGYSLSTSTSLDADTITTDGSGNLTAVSVTIKNTALTSDTFQGLVCSGSITSGVGYTFASPNMVPCAFNSVPIITTSTIQNVDGTQAAIQAICTALGIAQG